MRNRHISLLLFATMILSFTPLFTRFIALDAAVLTWWRVLLAAAILVIHLAARRQLQVPPERLHTLAVTGVLLGLHWWTFFLSIQASSVSIGVLTLFTYPLMSALLEPVTRGVPYSLRQLVGGIGIVAGVYLLVPEFSFSNSSTRGVAIGLISALFYALRNISTKKHLSEIRTMTTLFYQLLFALLALTLVLALGDHGFTFPAGQDSGLLLLLALVFTLGGHGLMTHCFKLFSASTVGIVGSLQVVFSTLLAALLLSEIPDTRIYLGGLVILSVAVYELLPHYRKDAGGK